MVDMQEILAAREQADCLFDAVAVEKAIARMAAEITQELQHDNPLVYVVMNGGLLLAGRILPLLSFPLEVSYLHATRYNGQTSGAALQWRARPMQNLHGRTVLVLDDVLDEGRTLAEVIDYLQQVGSRRVYSAVLTHKRHERKAYPGMRADFTGLEVPDRYVFGYGMDYRGYWRNLPGVFAVKGM